MSAQTFWFNLLLFSMGSLQILMFPPVLAVLILLVAGLVFSFIRQEPLSSEAWHWSYWLVLTQLLFYPAIVAVGVLFPASTWPNPPHENVTGGRWLDALSCGSVATSCFWVYRMKGLRWFAASLVGLIELLVSCARFVMGMRITGQWL